MIKIIFSDMDGTLLDDQGNLPSAFAETASLLKDRGVLFAPASGRQYFSLLQSFEPYKDEFLFVAENGTLVMYKGQELSSRPLAPQLAQEAFEAAYGMPDVYVVMACKRAAYILRSQDNEVIRQELEKYYTYCQPVDSFDEIDDVIIKVSVFDANATAPQTIYPRLAPLQGRVQVTLSSDYWVDAVKLGSSKGVAVREIQQRLHITSEECAAFGDYMNDAEMMQAVDYSFAMANAHPRIRELARYETGSNNEGGVLSGIKRLLEEGLI